MLTGRRYRLALTPAQVAECERFADLCRVVWNTGLEQRREYRRRGGWMDYVPQAAELAEAKKDHPWLTEAPSHVLQQTLMDLDRACRERGTFAVRWRSKRRWAPSFRFPAGRLITVERLGRKWGRAKLPKLGWVRFRWSRPLGGVVRSATLRRSGGQWYVSFLVDDGAAPCARHDRPDSAVGVDRGIKAAVVTSNGDCYDRRFVSESEDARLRRLRRKATRQRRGSHARGRTLAAIASVSARTRNRRTDFCVSVAGRLCRANALVVLEDLCIRAMTARVKTGARGAGQKSRLNRAILDKGWHRFELAVRSAARYTGTEVVLVNPAYTSQTCSSCGVVDRKSRKSQADFRCTACGHTSNADVNAARNILRTAGHAVPGRGDLQPRGGSTKRATGRPGNRTATGRSSGATGIAVR